MGNMGFRWETKDLDQNFSFPACENNGILMRNMWTNVHWRNALTLVGPRENMAPSDDRTTLRKSLVYLAKSGNGF